jgi:hypothetical protein
VRRAKRSAAAALTRGRRSMRVADRHAFDRILAIEREARLQRVR